MREFLCNAISSKSIVKVWYKGGYRYLEPHACGIGSKGHDLVRSYQVGGHSNSGEEMGWKLMVVDRVSEPESGFGFFDGPRPDYKMNDSAMPLGIYCQLEYKRETA
jgi:hypothetical protein